MTVIDLTTVRDPAVSQPHVAVGAAIAGLRADAARQAGQPRPSANRREGARG